MYAKSDCFRTASGIGLKKDATPDGPTRRDRSVVGDFIDWVPDVKIAFRRLFSTQFLRRFENNPLLGTCFSNGENGSRIKFLTMRLA